MQKRSHFRAYKGEAQQNVHSKTVNGREGHEVGEGQWNRGSASLHASSIIDLYPSVSRLYLGHLDSSGLIMEQASRQALGAYLSPA